MCLLSIYILFKCILIIVDHFDTCAAHSSVTFSTNDHYDHELIVSPSCVHLPGVFVDEDVKASTNSTTSKTVCEPRSSRPQRPSALASISEALYKPPHKFSPAAILHLHNVYRSSVEPPAGDMTIMEWHADAAMLAQKWAQNCIFDHGFPDHPLSEHLGQNLYIGPDATGLRATQLWFDERAYYDFKSLSCQPNEMCGHYTQGVWAKSKYLGCGIARCPNQGNLIVCHYYPKGNYIGIAPYEIGSPCSLCPDSKNGGLCFNNSCVSQSYCKEKKLSCNCPLQCHNCGHLDQKRCRCQCRPGWDRLDCSEPCTDVHAYCRKNPGFPDIRACSADNAIKTVHCRQMCHQCSVAENLRSMNINQLKALCCVGKVCSTGYVLSRYCTCVPKCPGPACSEAMKDLTISSAALLTMIAMLTLFYNSL